jgi:hypothetical protein
VGRSSLFVLVGGLAVLAAGTTVAVARHDRAVDSRFAPEIERYDAALSSALAQPPRVAVSYVTIPLALVRRLSRAQFDVVQTEVGRRLLTGRPPVRPDFAALAADRDDPIARMFKARAATERRVAVVGLLVEQRTPGRVTHLRLHVDRIALSSFARVYDPLDLLPNLKAIGIGFLSGAKGVRTREVVTWRPRPGVTAFVPLAIIHLFWVEQTPGNQDVIDALGLPAAQVTSHVALGPRRLLLRMPDGRDVEIRIDRALHPIVVAPQSVG